MKKLYYRYDEKTKVNVFKYVGILIATGLVVGIVAGFLVSVHDTSILSYNNYMGL